MVNNKSKQKAINFWLACTQDNLEAAKAMFVSGKWSLCMFMCQQTVEALLKAVFIVNKGSRPEYIHKLPNLLQLTGITVPKSIDTKILRIDAHYIKARYKEDRFDPRIYNKKNAKNLLKDTEDVLQWFIRNLKLKI
ncbi:MAG: HEPN domain-containing protein [Candidatus Omnitrophota bacterium]